MILNLSPYWSNPITGGGPNRVSNLNKIISKKYEIFQFSIRPTISMKGKSLMKKGNKIVRINQNYMEYQ